MTTLIDTLATRELTYCLYNISLQQKEIAMDLNKNTLVKYLNRILENTSIGLANSDNHLAAHSFMGNDATITFTSPGQAPVIIPKPNDNKAAQTISVVDDGYFALKDFIDECNKDIVIERYIGQKAIMDELETLIRKWFNHTVDNKAMVSDIRLSLQHLRELVMQWNIHLSLDNIVLNGLESFQLGSVKLMPTIACRSELKSKLFKNLDDSANDEITKQSAKVQLDDQITEFYPANGTTAVLTVSAEESYLRDVVERKLDEVLNILRGFTHLIFPREHQCLFGIKGWLVKGHEAFISVAMNDSKWNYSKNLIGAKFPYELTTDKVDFLRKNCALDIFDAILHKNEYTQFENALLVASHWHGSAINAPTSSQEFVWHTVALERLLICDKESSTTERFAKRLAWLLGTTGEERCRISKLATQLYDIRSRIVHAGDTIVSPDSLAQIDYLTSVAMIVVAQKTLSWKKQEEFRDWVEGSLLGA